MTIRQSGAWRFEAWLPKGKSTGRVRKLLQNHINIWIGQCGFKGGLIVSDDENPGTAGLGTRIFYRPGDDFVSKRARTPMKRGTFELLSADQFKRLQDASGLGSRNGNCINKVAAESECGPFKGSRCPGLFQAVASEYTARFTNSIRGQTAR